MMKRSLCCLAVLFTLVPVVLRAEPSAPQSRAEVLGIAHLPKVEVEATIYEVIGAPADTLEPYDLEALMALVAETRARHNPSVIRNVGGEISFWGPPDTDGARLLTAPRMTIRAGKNITNDGSKMSVGNEIYADSQGIVRDPKTYAGEETLRRYFNGVEFHAQAWQDTSTQGLVVEVHATVYTFEDFIDIQVAQPDGSSTPMKIPVVDTTICEGVVPLKNGETKIFTWRENFTEESKSLIVATVTAKILPPKDKP